MIPSNTHVWTYHLCKPPVMRTHPETISDPAFTPLCMYKSVSLRKISLSVQDWLSQPGLLTLVCALDKSPLTKLKCSFKVSWDRKKKAYLASFGPAVVSIELFYRQPGTETNLHSPRTIFNIFHSMLFLLVFFL